MCKSIPIIILLIFGLVGCSVDDFPSIPYDSGGVIASSDIPPSDSEQTRKEDIEIVSETVIQSESETLIETKTLATTETSSETKNVNTPSVDKCDVLDDATAEKMYLEASILLSDFVSGFTYDNTDIINVDGNIYYRVTEDKYSDYKSLVSLLKTYFTDSCVDELLPSSSDLSHSLQYIEYEGDTYTNGGILSSNVHIGERKYLGFSVTGNEAKIYVSTVLLDHDLLHADTVVNTFRLKFENGYWRFDNFYLNHYDFKIEFDRDENETAPQTGSPVIPLAITALLAASFLSLVMLTKRSGKIRSIR